jgi:hypothetical protein
MMDGVGEVAGRPETDRLAPTAVRPRVDLRIIPGGRASAEGPTDRSAVAHQLSTLIEKVAS